MYIIPKMYNIMICIYIYNIYFILASMTVDNVEGGENLYLLLIFCYYIRDKERIHDPYLASC